MGRISKVDISIANGQDTFLPGDVVSGNVVIKIERPVKISVISIRMSGACDTHWKGTGKSSYHDHEQYCLFKTILWGEIEGFETELAVGEFSKPFCFQLPENCPSSLKSENGNVLYSLEVVCKFPGMLMLNQSCSLVFCVYDIVDLATDPETSECWLGPQRITKELDNCFSCCQDNAVEFDLTLGKTGYVPGDFVTLNGFIENRCDSPVPFKITLKQLVTCKTYWRGKLQRRIQQPIKLLTWVGNPVPSRSKKVFENQPTLEIPSIVASFLRHCKLISVEYYLKIKVNLPGSVCNSRLKRIYILIGGQLRTEQFPEVTEPLTVNLPSVSDENLPEQQPPSYEQSKLL